MNIFTQALTFKTYSLLLISPLSFIILSLWITEWYFEPLSGDLTRVGYLPEKDFGWRQAQAFVPETQLKSNALVDADVFVLGDSFSGGLLWQSRLVSHHFTYSNIHWDQFKPCENVGDALRHAGFKGHYIIIQSVERAFQERTHSLCKENNNIDVKIQTKNAHPAIRPPRSLLSSMTSPIGGDWTIKALINSIKVTQLSKPDDYVVLDNARVVVMENGCHFFSNDLCHYGLFYNDDFKTPAFDSINNVLAINHNLLKVGIQPIWLVVPDKSTVYLNDKNSAVNIWDTLAQHPKLLAPNLQVLFKQQSKISKDFYNPNDTHLSVNGFLYLGDVVLKQLQ